MKEVDPETALSAVETERERRRDRAVDALEWFREREGLVPRTEAVSALADVHDWSEAQSNRAIGDVVGDLVDPVQQVVHPERGKLVGIIEFHEAPDSGAYAYVDYDDVAGRRKRVVCSQCVMEAETDAEVAHATEGEGTSPADATWEQLYTSVEDHYESDHDVEPSDIEVGASLASGTTISGSTAFHAGNDGVGSGLDADSLEGNEPEDIGGGAVLGITALTTTVASASTDTFEGSVRTTTSVTIYQSDARRVKIDFYTLIDSSGNQTLKLNGETLRQKSSNTFTRTEDYFVITRTLKPGNTFTQSMDAPNGNAVVGSFSIKPFY